MKRSIRLLLITSCISVIGFSFTAAAALDQNISAKPAANSFEGYEYIANPDDNLTLLVRRSLMIESEKNGGAALSPAAVIYAETNIVQRLGGFQLTVGQDVRLDKGLLDDYINSAKDLSPIELSAWNAYVDGADFTLDYIQPVTAQPTFQTRTNDNGKSAVPVRPPASSAPLSVSKQNRPVLALKWWLIGLLVLGGIIYLLDSRQQSGKR